jgi:hypothetical protein
MARSIVIGLIGALLVLGLGGPALSDGSGPTTGATPPATVTTSSALFKDVPADHWAIGDLQFLVERGIITGLPNGQFKGDQSMTRYAAAAMVARALRFALNNPDVIKGEDLKVMQELIYKVNDRLQKIEASGSAAGAEQLASLQAKVQQQAQAIQSLQAQVGSAKAGSPDVSKLRDQANASFIIGLAGLFVGIMGIALAVM